MNQSKEEKDLYKKALDMTLALLRERLQGELVALYLGGSYLRGDFIPGWSDIDITTIVKDEVWENESLKREFFRKCDIICKEVEDAYGIKVGLGFPMGTTSESVARNKVNLASFLSRTEKLIFGRDIFKEARPIEPEKIPEWGRAATIWICDHLLDNFQHKETIGEENLLSLAKETVIYIMKIAQNSLFTKGIVKFKKKEIVDAFEREYSYLEFKEVVREAYELQLAWQEAKEDSKRLMNFIGDTKKFIQVLKRILVQEQSRATCQ